MSNSHLFKFDCMILEKSDARKTIAIKDEDLTDDEYYSEDESTQMSMKEIYQSLCIQLKFLNCRIPVSLFSYQIVHDYESAVRF